ncbi:MAG: sigma-70 family RNA polymerase sigma factor [Elusimicrobia bacterium]|nr:sigma-70 family RNA polymerase sigma factor [Elusimicrobiota bacterium]
MPGPSEFERLVGEYGEKAFQFAYGLTGSADEARELVQAAFCRAFEHWDSYDRSQPVRNWLYTILRHLFLDRVRRAEREGVVLSLDEPGPEEDGELADVLEDRSDRVLEALEREESGSRVRDAFRSLARGHREVLTLADLDGLSYEDIAKVIRCPIGTVRSRVNRARGALKRRLLEEVSVCD